jgi:putative flippase GtrA
VLIIIKDIFFGKSDNSLIHLVRSVISGSFSSILDFTVLFILVEVFQYHYIISGIIGLILGTSANYILSIKWIFNSRNLENKKLEYIIFIFLGLIGGLLNLLLLWLFTEKAEIYYMYSRIFAATIVFFFNFIARKLILFSST